MAEGSIYKGLLRGADPNKESSAESLRFPVAQDVLHSLRESGDLEKILAEQPEWEERNVETIAADALHEMTILETAANEKGRWNTITPETARKIKRIIVFAAPGTYAQPFKNDRWREHPWAWGMDRYRDDRAARLAIALAGIDSGENFLAFDSYELLDANGAHKDVRERAKQAVENADRRLVYVGNKAEVDGVTSALNSPLAFIPKEKVDIVTNAKMDNTIDNTMALREYLQGCADLQNGDDIVFVAHGPQLVRIAGMLKHFKAVPEGINSIFEPLPIPRLGNRYPLMETRGIVAYSAEGRSSPKSCDYSILGVTSDQP